MKISVVMFDVIGTTVKESYPDAINDCFEKAFTDNDVTVELDFLKENRGKDKKEVIDSVVKSLNLSKNLSVRIHHDFQKNVENSLVNFLPNTGAEEIFSYLKQKNIKIGIGSGLSRSLCTSILRHLNWDASMFDYVGVTSEVGEGRPSPAMIHHFMETVGITEPTELLKVGDTVVDIHEGKNAGVITAVILSGTQPEEKLRDAKPDYVLQSLLDIKKIIS